MHHSYERLNDKKNSSILKLLTGKGAWGNYRARLIQVKVCWKEVHFLLAIKDVPLE